MSPRFIALYRVSTQKQQDSQLGLRAQQDAVRSYVCNVGGEIVEEVQEIESGSNKDKTSTKNQTLSYDSMLSKRPQLRHVITRAKKENLTIICKEPSRLTRWSILMGFLIEYKVQFIFSDCPNDDAMMIKLRTIFNEEENLRRSERTKLALAQLKKQGVKLGSARGFTDEQRKQGMATRTKAAKESIANRQAMNVASSESAKGLKLQEIADKLNDLGFRSRRGKEFKKMTVKRLLEMTG